ncbi:MAG: hypothetical protein LBQ76_04000 [Candidatus Fibromonas sp.]|jgi:hypothetical protein|nr:hypothetical protein [Candidatus Fibromonas sp.]
MLDSNRTARVLGSLVTAQGVVLVVFWRILAMIVATATARYANFTGRMAKNFFAQDRALAELLKTGKSFLTPLLILGIIITLLGVLMILFPKKTVKILIFLRILRAE